MGLRDGQRASIDVSFIFGDDFRVSDLTDPELLAYIRIWCRAVQCRRHLLPPKFNRNHTSTLAKLLLTHRETVARMLRKCGENALLTFLEDGRIIVNGVGVKHSWMVFKDGPNGEDFQTKNAKHYSDKDEGGRKKDEGSEDEGGDSASAFSSAFPEIFEILNGIDAKGYRTLRPYEGLETDLVEWVERLGRDRVIAETKALRTWLEGRFQTGQERREKRHIPGSRLLNWLKMAEKIDKEKLNAHSGSTRVRESYTDRLIREAAEAKAQVG